VYGPYDPSNGQRCTPGWAQRVSVRLSAWRQLCSSDRTSVLTLVPMRRPMLATWTTPEVNH